ncbi:MAG: hypothetical protein JW746_07620 [Candidatus Krumholzibacteriota bacterium]|nr:hypothetical protein [Candidatus Krumholzibacteriota bacterium]
MMEILIAGEAAPASIGSNGNIITAVPMFLDGSGLPDPPTGKADIDIYEDGDLLARIEDGVTIEVFPSAPGTFDEAVTVLDDIAATVDSISNFLVTAPGAGESYTYAFFVALDSLLNGDGEYSLAEVLKDQTEDSVAVILLNGLYETNGIVGHLRTMSEMFGDLYAEMDAQAASGRSAGLSPLAPSAEGPYIVDDDLLALMMQVYVVMRIFGQEFIAETGAEFANTIGTIMGAVGLSGRLQGPGRMVAITQAILAYLDFVVNKVAIGFLPAHLDILDLSLASNEIMQGTKTQATITATASNDPATITLNYLVGNTLTLLGLGESSTLINPTTQLLEDIASYFLGLAQGALSSYADSHPELDLDVELGSIVPAMVWKAEVDDYRLVVLHSDDQDLLAPMEYENNWQSSSQYEGLADIWVIPSVDSEAHVLPAVLPINYAGGAFGEDITLSNREEVDVLGRLALEIDFPSSVEYEGAGALGIRAGYRQLDGTIVWSPDIDIAISVTGGTPEQSIGTTDSEGHFSTVVHADVPGFEEMTIRVMASGDQDSYGEKEITAQIDHCGGHTFELIWNCPSVWDCQEYFRTEFCVTSSLPDCYWHMHIFDYWSDGSLTGDDRGDYFGETGCATYIHYGDCTGTGVLVRIELLLTVSCFDGEGCDIGTIEERVVIPMP